MPLSGFNCIIPVKLLLDFVMQRYEKHGRMTMFGTDGIDQTHDSDGFLKEKRENENPLAK